MNKKQQIAAKIAEAQVKALPGAAPSHMNKQTFQVPTMIRSVTTAANIAAYKKSVINLSATLKEKLQFLLFAKPIIVNHAEESIADDLNLSKLKLQETMFALEGILFEHGFGHVIIEPMGDSVRLRLADPKFPNVVRRFGNIPYEAELWKVWHFNRAAYWVRTLYKEDKIITTLHQNENGGDTFDANNLKEIDLTTINKELPESLQIKGEMDNPYKIIPVVEFTYTPTADYTTLGMKALAPEKRIQALQIMLDEGTAALRLELYLNRTKLLVDKDLLSNATKEQAAAIAAENIIAVVGDSGDDDGKDKVVEVMQGDPKVDQYWTNITNIISMAVSMLKLSELGEGDSASSATGEIFNKGNDVETANALGTFRQGLIAEVLEKVRIIAKAEGTPEKDLDADDWGIQIVPNVIMNEAKITDMVIAQLGAGLINMTQAKVKLENISQEDAKAQLEEEEVYHNPTLNAVSSFDNEDDAEDPEKEDPKNPTTKENKPKPE